MMMTSDDFHHRSLEDSPTPRATRPHFVPGYGIKADDEGKGLLPWSVVEERLRDAHNYWVCTTRADGRPHAMPVWGLWLNNLFLFSTDSSSIKGRNLWERPDVVIHLESGDSVVIVEGTARRIVDDALGEHMVDEYERKYAVRIDRSNPAFALFEVRPRAVLAWTEEDFVDGATRWQLEEDR
jgi:hypothetical protein